MKESKRESKIPTLAALMIVCVFAVCILVVLLTGAKSYQAIASRNSDAYTQRTAAQYITMRVRQGSGFRLEDFEGYSALVLREDVAGEVYLTRVYCCGGYIRELFAREDSELPPEAGEKILKAENLSFELEGSLLTVRIGFADGTEQVLVLSLREGVAA